MSDADGCSVYFMLALVAMQVYKARWNGVLVAVKALTSEDPAEAEAFQREIAVLEVLRHPHVVNYLAMLIADDGAVRTDRRNTPEFTDVVLTVITCGNILNPCIWLAMSQSTSCLHCCMTHTFGRLQIFLSLLCITELHRISWKEDCNIHPLSLGMLCLADFPGDRVHARW